jgi:hypothetical protein
MYTAFSRFCVSSIMACINPRLVFHFQQFTSVCNLLERFLRPKLTSPYIMSNDEDSVVGMLDETTGITISTNETPTSKDEEQKSNPTIIHFNGLVPNGNITDSHIEKIMGFQAYDKVQTRELLERQKREVRAWASTYIKKIILKYAQKLQDRGRLMAIRVDDFYKPQDIKDIHLWWDNLNVDDDEEMAKARRSLYFILYNVFEKYKGWELELERLFLADHNWKYDEDSKKNAEQKNQRVGYQLKGCVAKNISHVKYEIVKAFQKRCRGSGDGTYVHKARPKEDAYDEEGNYVRRAKSLVSWSRMPVEKDNKIDLDGSSDEAEETDHEEDINVNSKKVRLLLSLFLTILFVSNIDLTFISTSILFRKERQQQTTIPPTKQRKLITRKTLT